MNTTNINEQGFSSLSDPSPATRLTPTGTVNGHEIEDGIFENQTNKPSGTRSKELSKRSKPFNHLPEELINEVFLHCASSPIEICGDPPCTPWSLAQVSQRWRTIALSEPNLWTSITVDLDWQPAARLNQRTDALLNFFRGCLHRSRDRPLYLRVKAFQRIHPLLFPLTDLCLAEAHRWQTVSLHFSLSPFMAKLEKSRGRLSLLKALSLTHEYRPAFAITAFVASPQLTHLTLCKLHHPTSSLKVPWNQITHFESNLLKYRQGELDQILTNMPLLEELKVVCGISLSSTTDHNATVEIISLPHLRSFHISGHEEALNQILNLLHTPSLKHFAIETMENGTRLSDLVVSAFLGLHHRSQFTLDSLSIDKLPVQSTVRILDLVPSITHLSVQSRGVTEFLPTYLTLNRDAPITTARKPFHQEWGSQSRFFLVPNLRNLVMEDPYTFADSATLASSAHALLKMVKSRLNPQGDSEGRLESVSIVALLAVGLSDADTLAFDVLTEFGGAEGVKMDVDVKRKGGTLHNLTSLRSAN